ncbi:hypothetical protein BDQ94DRAFT_143352 [Aspergillus welwitschiae]|uniref:Uncharacterized protein n=1 Tax=Aspergillus welwitschiae TaxID=1341132 RepID=A0A3F3Q3M1_9EURO|nr:hypothetical protein BDQ94DRAFT_143352 [Aspergillus welwitschiae]RDH33572.1 hypothetical protein BDQ94DRAFT_143352 [Aspergillus welwitschiae]
MMERERERERLIRSDLRLGEKVMVLFLFLPPLLSVSFFRPLSRKMMPVKMGVNFPL